MKKFVVLAGLLAGPSASGIEAAPPPDPRLTRIQKFFKKYDCPLADLSEEFLQQADSNQLDWRLLPSLSFIESSGGKYLLNNNVFGWNSCRTRFPSVRAGIGIVASQLGRSSLYKNKPLDQVLRTYNPRPDYGKRVKSLMRSMGGPAL